MGWHVNKGATTFALSTTQEREMLTNLPTQERRDIGESKLLNELISIHINLRQTLTRIVRQVRFHANDTAHLCRVQKHQGIIELATCQEIRKSAGNVLHIIQI